MKTKNAKEIAKIDRQLDRLEAEFATIKNRSQTNGCKRCSIITQLAPYLRLVD